MLLIMIGSRTVQNDPIAAFRPVRTRFRNRLQNPNSRADIHLFLIFRNEARDFQQAAGNDAGTAGIFSRRALRLTEVHRHDTVLTQIGDTVMCHAFSGIQIFFLLCVGVAVGKTVYSPALPSGPG